MPLRTPKLYPIPIDPTRRVYGVELKRFTQKNATWCWAACVEMVLDLYEILPRDAQCVIAQKGIKLVNTALNADCCKASGFFACNKTLGDDTITRLWRGVYHVDAGYVNRTGIAVGDRSKLVRELVDLLNQKTPVQIGYFNTGGHVVMLYGHDKEANSATFRFYFRDPDPKKNEEVAVPSGELFNAGFGLLNATWELRKPRKRGPR